MSFPQTADLALAFTAGAILSAVLVWLALSRRSERRLLDTARRLSAAEARAEQLELQHREAEDELTQVRERASELARQLAVADERVTQARQLVEQQKSFVAEARGQLENSFKALAAAALEGSTEQLLTLAEQRLGRSKAEAAAELDERKNAIETLLAPLGQTLERLEKRTGELETSRVSSYSRLSEQLQSLAQTTSLLQSRTASLNSALRRGSEARGRWGEITLRNIAELAGMTEHADFVEQLTLDGGRRPDMVVHLPGDRLIAIDAKAPLAGYLEAIETDDPEAGRRALERHTRDLRQHLKSLARRDYAERLESDVDLVVMFLPGDQFLGAAFSIDPNLQIDALRAKVLIATPTTLVALLRTVAIYWQQKSLADNAETIADTARELYDRAAKFSAELGRVGRNLESAVQAYNKAVGSFDRRLMPLKRRLDDMKVAEHSKRELDSPQPVVSRPREVGG